MNKIIVSGNTTKDAELTYTSGKGTAILKFGVAVARRFKKEDGTDFINCTVIGKRAEGLANYLSKGTKVIIEGALRINSYEKKDGTKGYSTEILVSNVEMIGGKPKEQDELELDMEPVTEGDIPF